MRIGNRNFPYPVLNKEASLSDYVAASTFRFDFDVGEDGNLIIENGEVVFKNLHYTLTDSALLKLIETGKLRGAFVVECSASMYRRKFDISVVPNDLCVSTNEINGNMVASCYLYATEDISNFQSDGFVPEYSGYTFDIDKFDILAVDDGFNLRIDHDPIVDDKMASIFTVVKKEDNSDILTYVNSDKHIVIQLPSQYFAAYDKIKMRRECNNIAFSMLAIPVLAKCLDECVQDGSVSSMEDILDQHPWFNAVRISYKQKTGRELQYDDFIERNKLELAQTVLNCASCNGLKDFYEFLLSSDERSDEDE